jgi:hypothetical protein
MPVHLIFCAIDKQSGRLRSALQVRDQGFYGFGVFERATLGGTVGGTSP